MAALKSLETLHYFKEINSIRKAFPGIFLYSSQILSFEKYAFKSRNNKTYWNSKAKWIYSFQFKVCNSWRVILTLGWFIVPHIHLPSVLGRKSISGTILIWVHSSWCRKQISAMKPWIWAIEFEWNITSLRTFGASWLLRDNRVCERDELLFNTERNRTSLNAWPVFDYR